MMAYFPAMLFIIPFLLFLINFHNITMNTNDGYEVELNKKEIRDCSTRAKAWAYNCFSKTRRSDTDVWSQSTERE